MTAVMAFLKRLVNRPASPSPDSLDPEIELAANLRYLRQLERRRRQSGWRSIY
jgi:hypothetical protein